MSPGIGILGGGALGTLFAHALAGVTGVRLLVRRPEALEEIERSGVRVVGLEPRRVAVTARPADFTGIAMLFVAVKTYDTVAALGPLRGVLAPEVPIVVLQNGLDGEVRAHVALGDAHPVVLAPTSEAATPLGFGASARIGAGSTALGRAKPGMAADPTGVAALLRAAGLDARVAEPIEPHVWAKAIANAAINPVGALLDLDNGGVATDPQAREFVHELAREGAAVAAASGVELPFEDAVEHAFGIARTTGANHSSMWHDLRTGRLTEIDALNGAIAARGALLGVPTPVNVRIVDEVKRRSAAYGVGHA